jgi:hypothetical protein
VRMLTKPTQSLRFRRSSRREGRSYHKQNCYPKLRYMVRALKSKLLFVLKRPEMPIHPNESETDIRDYVKKRKVSGGTRSDVGQQCRDTFASLKKTCRKLGVSFWQYLIDRHHDNLIPPLPVMLSEKRSRTTPTPIL